MIEVKPTENGRWGLIVNGILIGDSKGRTDADHAKVMLEKALQISEPSLAVAPEVIKMILDTRF